jgi:cysteinyl-tRNA synthetase
MHWESPWGVGFPGWHLECSAIIHATLGDPIDVHAGGVDHIGTHHPNEMAQTEGAFQNNLANFWLHNEHILVNGEKMSKSLGNFYTLKDLKEKNFSPLAYRFLVLQAHYRSQLNFTWESLGAASQAYSRLKENITRRLNSDYSENREEVLNLINSFPTKFLEIISDDLDSPKALAELNVFIKNIPDNLTILEKEVFSKTIQKVDEILGLSLLEVEQVGEVPQEVVDLAEKRELSRKHQQFAQSDALRKEIEQLGYLVQDGPQGYILKKK